MNIVVLDDWELAFTDSPQLPRLQELGHVTIFTHKAGDRDETRRRLEQADIAVLIRERTPLDRSILEQLPRLTLIAQTGGGAAHIDHQARQDCGIEIAYTPGSSRQSVVELTFGLAIAALRTIPDNHALMRQGAWPQGLGRTLRGKRLSIIGFGEIGGALVPAARVFGMDVLAWGREGSRQRAVEMDVPFTDDLRVAIGRGDVVSVHLKLNDDTRGVIREEHLSALRPGSVLINTSRGAVIEETALLRRLEVGDVTAALDVFHEEPLSGEHPLRSMENVILSPHIGWITDNNYENVIAACIRNIEAFA